MTFIQIGDHWINFDEVMSVDFVEDKHAPGKLVAALVHYRTGKTQDFTVPAEIEALSTWLQAHKSQ
jgi:hypothetical protein